MNKKNNEIKQLKKESKENNDNASELNEKINNLNSSIENQKEKYKLLNEKEINEKANIENLKTSLKENSKIIKKTENVRDSYKIKYKKNPNELKVKNEKNLKDNLKKIENKNIKEEKELSKKIEDITNEKSLLSKAVVDKDTEALNKFYDLGLLKKTMKENNNFIEEEDKEVTNFNDVKKKIKSVKDISKDWEINEAKEEFKELIEIRVIGNSNKGKSLIPRIYDLSSGIRIITEGLSFNYLELGEEIVILDSAGFEVPFLKTQISPNI